MQGLCLDLKHLRMSPKLLARLAHSVAGKQDVRKVVGQLLPDLCQVWTSYSCPASRPSLNTHAAAGGCSFGAGNTLNEAWRSSLGFPTTLTLGLGT